MKAKIIILAVLILSASMNAFSQEKTKTGIFTFKGKKKEHTIGAYAGLSGTYTEIMGRNAFWAGGKLGVVFDSRFTIGVAGSALWYDYKLTAVADDGTCHLESGYAGLYLEYMLHLTDRFRLGFSVILGQGTAKYTYDKDYREGKTWYERTIDQDDFAVTEPGVEFLVKLSPNWWVGVNGSYKFTSPLELKGTPESAFNTFSGGLSVRYGIF